VADCLIIYYSHPVLQVKCQTKAFVEGGRFFRQILNILESLMNLKSLSGLVIITVFILFTTNCGSSKDDGETEGGETEGGQSEDSIPTQAAASVTFSDTDSDGGELTGDVVVIKASDESSITHYVFYWGSSTTEKQNEIPIVTIAKSNNNITHTFATNTNLPTSATHILVFTKNADGEMGTAVHVAIEDFNLSITSTPPVTAETGEPYAYQLQVSNPNSYDLSFSLGNAPIGMTIQSITGKITWTPAPGQTQSGDVTSIVTTETGLSVTQILSQSVTVSAITYPGDYFIATNGNSANDGSPSSPLDWIKTACDDGPAPGSTIYVRGGTYKNDNYGLSNDNSAFPDVLCSGTVGNPITIKPYGNEKVKFQFDGFSGVKLKGNYLVFEGFEIEGPAENITYEEALADWWIGSKIFNGNGIVVNGHHVTVRNNVVHNTTGSGIFYNEGGDYGLVENNIVYNAAWWSTKGTTAIGIINSTSSDSSVSQNIKVIGNLIFASESRIFSRVFSKRYAELAIDEGSGTLVQFNGRSYQGGYLIQDNFYLYNGKGLAVAYTDKVNVINNTLYMNGSTINGTFTGLRVNKAIDINLSGNAVHVSPENLGYSVAAEVDQNDAVAVAACQAQTSGNRDCSIVNSSNNYYVGGDDPTDLPAGNSMVTQLFVDPSNLDFTIIDGNPNNIGASAATWATLKALVDEYGIVIRPTNWQPDLAGQTKSIAENLPAGATVDNQTDWPHHVWVYLPDNYLGTDADSNPDVMDLRIVTEYERE
jgi:hypothetical protein